MVSRAVVCAMLVGCTGAPPSTRVHLASPMRGGVGLVRGWQVEGWTDGLLWTWEAPSTAQRLLAWDDLLLVSLERGVAALDAGTGEVRWQQPLDGTPLLSDCDGQLVAVVPEVEQVVGIDVADGTLLYTLTGSSPRLGTLLCGAQMALSGTVHDVRSGEVRVGPEGPLGNRWYTDGDALVYQTEGEALLCDAGSCARVQDGPEHPVASTTYGGTRWTVSLATDLDLHDGTAVYALSAPGLVIVPWVMVPGRDDAPYRFVPMSSTKSVVVDLASRSFHIVDLEDRNLHVDHIGERLVHVGPWVFDSVSGRLARVGEGAASFEGRLAVPSGRGAFVIDFDTGSAEPVGAPDAVGMALADLGAPVPLTPVDR